MANHTFTADPDSLEIITTYVFDAPRERVFEAYADPSLIPKWWGEDNGLKVEKMEVKPGGSWRFVMGGGDQEFAFRGVYHDVIAPKKLVATWQYEDAPTTILQTVTFEELAEPREVTIWKPLRGHMTVALPNKIRSQGL